MRGRGRIWLYLRVLPLVLLACNAESRHLVAQTLEQILFGPSCEIVECGTQAKAPGAQGHQTAAAVQTVSGAAALPGTVTPIFGLCLLMRFIPSRAIQVGYADRDNRSRAPPIPFQNAFFVGQENRSWTTL
ncbi:MAG: hypothetical protein C4331_17595 [Meiothermus sp.]